MNTPITVSLTVDFLANDAITALAASGNDIFAFLIENKMAYSFVESGDFGEVAAFIITVENYFQFQALGDFLYK